MEKESSVQQIIRSMLAPNTTNAPNIELYALKQDMVRILAQFVLYTGIDALNDYDEHNEHNEQSINLCRSNIVTVLELYGSTAMVSMQSVFNKFVDSGLFDVVEKILLCVPNIDVPAVSRAIDKSASNGNYKTLKVLLAHVDRTKSIVSDVPFQNLLTCSARRGFYKTLKCLVEYLCKSASSVAEPLSDPSSDLWSVERMASFLASDPLLTAIEKRQVRSISYIMTFGGGLVQRLVKEDNAKFDVSEGLYAVQHTDIEIVVWNFCKYADASYNEFTHSVLKHVVRYGLCRPKIMTNILEYALISDDLDLAKCVIDRERDPGSWDPLGDLTYLLEHCVDCGSVSILRYVLNHPMFDFVSNAELIVRSMVDAVETNNVTCLAELIKSDMRIIKYKYGKIYQLNKFGVYAYRDQKNASYPYMHPGNKIRFHERYTEPLKQAVQNCHLACAKLLLRRTPQSSKSLLSMIQTITTTTTTVILVPSAASMFVTSILYELATDSRLVLDAETDYGMPATSAISAAMTMVEQSQQHKGCKIYIMTLLMKKYGIVIEKIEPASTYKIQAIRPFGDL